MKCVGLTRAHSFTHNIPEEIWSEAPGRMLAEPPAGLANPPESSDYPRFCSDDIIHRALPNPGGFYDVMKRGKRRPGPGEASSAVTAQ